MATTEHVGLLTVKNSAGDKQLLYPITTIEAVDGLEEALEKNAWILTGQINRAVDGSVTVNLYKDGVLATESAYLDSYVASGTAEWRQHGSSTGTFTGTKTWTFNGTADGIAWKCDAYADSTKATLLASATFTAGASGADGNPGIYYGTDTPPTDGSVLVWVNPSGTPDIDFAEEVEY